MQSNRKTLAPSFPRGVIVFCKRCKVFTFLHNSNHKAVLSFSILDFSFSLILSLFHCQRSSVSEMNLNVLFHLTHTPCFSAYFLLSLLFYPCHLLPFPIFVTPWSTQAPSTPPLSSLNSICILQIPSARLCPISSSNFIFIQNPSFSLSSSHPLFSFRRTVWPGAWNYPVS